MGHAEGVEHDYTIILMIGARLGLLNGRVECQMVDLRAVFGRSITQNSALIASRSSSIAAQTTKVGSFDRGESPRSNEPTFVGRGGIPDERDAIKAEFCVPDRPRTALRSTI